MLGLLPTVRLVSAGLKISPTRLIRIGLEIVNIYFTRLMANQKLGFGTPSRLLLLLVTLSIAQVKFLRTNINTTYIP